LYENVDVRIQGVIIGFDEFMNVVLDGAEEIRQDETKARTPLGRILLKGDNISVLQNAVK
jgi:small nuclear ribonucleoprotein E